MKQSENEEERKRGGEKRRRGFMVIFELLGIEECWMSEVLVVSLIVATFIDR